MIKKAVIIALCCFPLLGCVKEITSSSYEKEPYGDGRFKCISSEKAGEDGYGRVLVDNETGVEYFFYKVGYGGGLAMLVDKDGKPVIYEGETDE